jgi:hypothetical protein
MADIWSEPGDEATGELFIHEPWLKVPVDPTLNIPVKIRRLDRLDRDRHQTVHSPLGRADHVVVSDTRRKVRSRITLWVDGWDEWQTLDAILTADQICLLQLPSDEEIAPGRQWYLRITSSGDTPLTVGEEPIRDIELDWVEVTAP